MSTIQSVERAFAVLNVLAAGPAGVSDIAAQVDLPKSTVSRLLTTLVELGAVERAELAGGYALGELMVDLAAAASPESSLVALARPTLQRVVDELGEAAGLSMLDGSRVHYYDQVDAEDHEVQVRDWTGESVDFHVVASGLLLAAYSEPDARAELLDAPLESWTPTSMTDPKDLTTRLDAIESAGFVWAHEEMADGLNSVAAPIRNASGTVVAAIHAHGPSYRFPAERDPDAIAAVVVEAGAAVSDRLAGRLTDAHQSLAH